MNALEMYHKKLKVRYDAMVKPESEVVFGTKVCENAYADIMAQFESGISEAQIYVYSVEKEPHHFNLPSMSLRDLYDILQERGYKVEMSMSSNCKSERMFVKVDAELLREFALFGVICEDAYQW